MNDVKKTLWIIAIFILWSCLCTGAGFFISARRGSAEDRTKISQLEQRLADSESTVVELTESARLDGLRIVELSESNNRLRDQLDGAQSTIDKIISGLEISTGELSDIIEAIRNIRREIKEYQDSLSGDHPGDTD